MGEEVRIMKKWLIGGGIACVLAVALLAGGLIKGASAQETTPLASSVITPEQAKAAALADNPGATAVGVDLDREDGVQVYEVKLDNGLEVQVDASDGTILGSEQDDDAANDPDDVQEEVESQAEDADNAGDVDDVQEEVEGQPDDALEAPQAEDAPGQ
jgi:uncharacterized membrane protein YkoI